MLRSSGFARRVRIVEDTMTCEQPVHAVTASLAIVTRFCFYIRYVCGFEIYGKLRELDKSEVESSLINLDNFRVI